MNRRSFISSAAMTAGLGLSMRNRALAQNGGTFQKEFYFSVDKELLAQTTADGDIVNANAWLISERDVDMLPYLTGEQSVPYIATPMSAECISCNSGDAPAILPVPERFVEFRLLGSLPATELIGDIVRARAQDQYLDLAVSLFDFTSETRMVGTPTPSAQAPRGAVARVIEKLDYRRDWNVGPYKLQVRGPDPGGLDCATEARQHYHLELMQSNRRGGYDYKMNLHIAVWKQPNSSGKYCIAIANSQGWPKCLRVCNPTWNDFYKPILTALLTVGVSYVIAVTLASLVASALYGSLALL